MPMPMVVVVPVPWEPAGGSVNDGTAINVKMSQKYFLPCDLPAFNGRICQSTLVPVKLYGGDFLEKYGGR